MSTERLHSFKRRLCRLEVPKQIPHRRSHSLSPKTKVGTPPTKRQEKRSNSLTDALGILARDSSYFAWPLVAKDDLDMHQSGQEIRRDFQLRHQLLTRAATVDVPCATPR